jgi:hypothetical protein
VWHGFVVVLCFAHGLVVQELCSNAMWHLGCAFVCGVVTSKSYDYGSKSSWTLIYGYLFMDKERWGWFC